MISKGHSLETDRFDYSYIFNRYRLDTLHQTCEYIDKYGTFDQITWPVFYLRGKQARSARSRKLLSSVQCYGNGGGYGIDFLRSQASP